MNGRIEVGRQPMGGIFPLCVTSRRKKGKQETRGASLFCLSDERRNGLWRVEQNREKREESDSRWASRDVVSPPRAARTRQTRDLLTVFLDPLKEMRGDLFGSTDSQCQLFSPTNKRHTILLATHTIQLSLIICPISSSSHPPLDCKCFQNRNTFLSASSHQRFNYCLGCAAAEQCQYSNYKIGASR